MACQLMQVQHMWGRTVEGGASWQLRMARLRSVGVACSRAASLPPGKHMLVTLRCVNLHARHPEDMASGARLRMQP